jgi:hypothetical protein
MPKPAVGFTGVSDYIDAPMPFKITLSPFKPDAKQCSEAAGANSACRKCLKTVRTEDDWCSARWHPSCEGICADNACRSVCGTGGAAQEISATTFARSDGKAFPYSFDYHKNGAFSCRPHHRTSCYQTVVKRDKHPSLQRVHNGLQLTSDSRGGLCD